MVEALSLKSWWFRTNYWYCKRKCVFSLITTQVKPKGFLFTIAVGESSNLYRRLWICAQETISTSGEKNVESNSDSIFIVNWYYSNKRKRQFTWLENSPGHDNIHQVALLEYIGSCFCETNHRYLKKIKQHLAIRTTTEEQAVIAEGLLYWKKPSTIAKDLEHRDSEKNESDLKCKTYLNIRVCFSNSVSFIQ